MVGFAGMKARSASSARVIRVGEVPSSNLGAPIQKTQRMLGFLLGSDGSSSGADRAHVGRASPEAMLLDLAGGY